VWALGGRGPSPIREDEGRLEGPEASRDHHRDLYSPVGLGDGVAEVGELAVLLFAAFLQVLDEQG